MEIMSVIWNVNPEIFGLGNLSIRWYGLLFAASFFGGYVLFIKFFKKEKLDTEILDKLALYMAAGTILGARLGHCLFYEPDYYLSNPAEILFIWKGGLASHGAAIGILISLYLFIRKYHWNFIWLLDRIAIGVVLAGFFIRAGNLMNSEIYGEPTGTHNGFIYSRNLTDDLLSESQKKGGIEIKKIKYEKSNAVEINEDKYQEINLIIEFDKKERKKEEIEQFLSFTANRIIKNQEKYHDEINIVPKETDFSYDLTQTKNKIFLATIPIYGVPRHPTQIYEFSSYLFIFFLLIFIYYKKDAKFSRGTLTGLFFLLVFLARFLIEFLKEEQVSRENDMVLNLGQKLSIPLIVIGIVFLIISFNNKKVLTQTKD